MEYNDIYDIYIEFDNIEMDKKIFDYNSKKFKVKGGNLKQVVANTIVNEVIEELKSAGLWNEDAVKSMRPDFVEAALDFFRFTEEKFRIEKEQKHKEKPC